MSHQKWRLTGKEKTEHRAGKKCFAALSSWRFRTCFTSDHAQDQWQVWFGMVRNVLYHTCKHNQQWCHSFLEYTCTSLQRVKPLNVRKDKGMLVTLQTAFWRSEGCRKCSKISSHTLLRSDTLYTLDMFPLYFSVIAFLPDIFSSVSRYR